MKQISSYEEWIEIYRTDEVKYFISRQLYPRGSG